MHNFKPKSKKKIKANSKLNITLDSKHNEKIDEFENIKTVLIPQLQKEKAHYKNLLKDESLSLDKRLEYKDKIREIRKKLTTISKKEKDYFLNNSEHIFSYFEKKKDVSEGHSKKKILHSFFAKTKEKKDVKREETNLTQKYLCNIDQTFLNIKDYQIDYEVCAHCKGELVPIDNEGILVCKECHCQVKFLIENEKPSYKEPPKEVCFYAYKRINHFREILAQFQAKETTQIPEEVIEQIKMQIKKERITLKDMSNKKAKDILKKLGYNKYYEHIPFIKDKLGIKPPVMSPELEATLCNLFMEIQKPYAKHCPDDRVNFLNYYYVLYKICELLGEDKFLPFFPMLKDPVKRIEQDEIWKKICAELQWQFIETI